MTEDAKVYHLHQEPVVGEIVDDDHDGEPDRFDHNAGLPARRPPAALVRRVGGTVVKVAKDDRTQFVMPKTGRQLYTVGAGYRSWVVRIWDATTMGVYRRQIKAAEIRNDREALTDWLDRKEAAVQRRFQRIKEVPQIAKGFALVALGSFAAFVAIVLVSGLVAQLTGGKFGAVVLGVIGVFGWIISAVAIAWTPFLIALPFLISWAAYKEGKRRGNPPNWLMTANERKQDTEVITPSIVVKALRDLGIAELRKRIDAMDQAGAEMLGPIVLVGPGVEVQVQLPSSISTEDIQKRRKRLAENMGRHEHELFITIPRRARSVLLWIADSGALDEPIEPSPLVTDPPKRVSMHRDRAPWGKNLRDDPIGLNLWQKHLLITGLSNMGKTAALRALALWLAFDPTVEFRIADLKGLGDWRMFQGLATFLIEGPTDDHVISATEMLEAAVDEMERRMVGFDSDKYPDGVPPGLAGYHPIVVIVDEEQVAFMCPEKDEQKRPYGGKSNTSRYFNAARKVHNQGRAVNVLLWDGTQDPTDQNLPKLVREGAHIRAGLKLGSESQSRMALGDNAVNDGAAPHELKQEHKGTVVVTGMGVPTQQGQTSETVRTHYIGGKDAVKVADQAKQLRGAVDTADASGPDERDLLTDVDQVLGGEDARAADVPRRLRQHAPGFAPYKDMTGESLVAQLEALGVRRGSQAGYPMVRTERVRHALAEREVSDDED